MKAIVSCCMHDNQKLFSFLSILILETEKERERERLNFTIKVASSFRTTSFMQFFINSISPILKQCYIVILT